MGMIDRSNKNLSDTDYVETDHGPLSESDLWRAVLSQAISDTAIGDRIQRLEVARWLRTNDFVTVCNFADIDEDIIKDQVQNLLTMASRPLRKHYSKILCRSINNRVMKRDKVVIDKLS